MTTFSHIPVLKKRCLDLLSPAVSEPGAVFVDATLGLGGHTESALENFPNLRVVGLDRDLAALEHSRLRLTQYQNRITLIHAVYDQLPQVLAELEIPTVQGILFDLGVSSMQLDSDERGFAYSRTTPLDMRMDNNAGKTAADVVNTYSHGEIARILSTYGEERFASRIASAIVRERELQPFTTSDRLVAVVRDAIPAATRRTGGNPAKRTFQALRIEVNDELSILTRAIPAAIEALDVGGRLVVLSYHSLEDRIVKNAIKEVTESKAPVDLPFIPNFAKPKIKSLTRGSETATELEIAENSRATSVRLRAVQRVAA
jgi:16S rRNA (cytosine1402-N4)-methyltransferase